MTATSSVPHGSWSSLKAKGLQRLALLCGQSVTGRKAEISARLTRAVAAPPPTSLASGPVVLSIDLGIRNLAISLMTPTQASSSASSGPHRRKKAGAASPSDQLTGFAARPPSITLHHWQRLSLVNAQTTGVNSSTIDDEEASTEEVFSPANIAQLTNGFLQQTVLRMDPLPTHILIERQRWRSQSSTSILEWTVRVNTLEAMLHASLQALRDVGVYKGDVTSVRPESVGKFFLGAGEEGDPARDVSLNIKKAKIEMLGRWLSNDSDVIAPGNKLATEMIDAYKERVMGPRRRKTSVKLDKEENGEEKLTLDTKLDDLTDSLMQGMAWLRWQENIAILRQENGAEKLLQAASPSVLTSDTSKVAKK
ncbi:hypothetical protein RRF57_012282 [Xylaria bambusicola]|uniref:Mitochondrial resolvase Ydc2 catalytic domain-containing protein n=1 Tax=Xylaria bambusicola TaxID=326684 RepID=A0AAN7UPB0_9PEZI